jgi:hypothetical protein
MKELLQEPWLYTLYANGERLILTVVCGTVAVYELSIELTNEEKQQFDSLGKAFIHSLALQISSRPSDFEARRC